MSKKRYRLPARGKHAPADQHRPHDAPTELAARQAYYRECYERFAEFYGAVEYECSLRLYRETVELHRKERALREQVLDQGTLENYRWQVAGTLALRAAKALEQAREKLRKIKENARENALRCVELRFGPAREHDTAVTEGVGDLPPLLPEQREPGATETDRGPSPRRPGQPQPPLTPQQERWIDEVAEKADCELAATPSLITASG